MAVKKKRRMADPGTPELTPVSSPDEVLDAAVALTFPASDPISIDTAYARACERDRRNVAWIGRTPMPLDEAQWDQAALLAFKESWKSVEYDGIRGEIPEWMPAADRSEFNALRFKLFFAVRWKEVSLVEIMERFRWEREERFVSENDGITVDLSLPSNPELAKFDNDITRLAHLFEIVGLGPEQAFASRVGDEQIAGLERREQRKRATQPRTDALQGLIIEMLQKHPGFKSSEVVEELNKLIGGGVIESIKDGTIEWRDKAHPAGMTPLSAIKDRVSRARKQIKSR